MRKIKKGREPLELRRWKDDEVPQNLEYGCMPSLVKVSVKDQMLVEQGFLCAYTMQRILTRDDCHIEHIVPQGQMNQLPQMDVDYANMLVCVPSDTPDHRPKRGRYPFGAQEKAGTLVDENNFVSPLRDDVESRFQYSADGSIVPRHNDGAAESTIRILRLDHEQLVDLRKAAIDERIFPEEAALSVAEAEDLARMVMETRDVDGRLPEFCLAISQVALWYATSLRKID